MRRRGATEKKVWRARIPMGTCLQPPGTAINHQSAPEGRRRKLSKERAEAVASSAMERQTEQKRDGGNYVEGQQGARMVALLIR